MTSQGFSFPPPPPPPPATNQAPAQQPTQHGQNWGGHGGHGGGHGGGQRGRGRGQGNRGRGGNHASGGQAPSYLPPAGYNYAQPMYGGYPPQPLPTAPYMPPQPYHHGQPPAFQNPQNPPSFSSQQYPQSVASGNYQHYNTPNLPTYPPTPPTYMQGLPTPPHGHPPNNQAMMPPMSWRNDMPGAAPYMGAQPGQARGPRPPHAHGNQGPKPKHNQKRDHSAAFTKPQSTAPRTPAAPAVPSFGNPLPSKPPPAADSTANRKAKKRKRKHNQLGLTPNAEEHESSEEEADEDEESKLAQSGSNAAPLQFSYKGKTSTLQTPSDIAAWIAERRKKFPTQARVEENKKSMEEAKAAREAVRQQKQKEQQEKRKEHIQKQNEHKTDPAADATTNAQRREKIRRNLEREEKRIQKAMAETEAARLRMEALQKEALSLNADFSQDEDTGITTMQQHPTLDPVIKTEPANAPEPTIKTEPETAVPEPVINAEPETALPEATIKTEPHDPIPEPAQSADPAPLATEAQGDPGSLLESNNLEPTITEHPTDHDLYGMEIASDHGASDWTSSGASGSDSDSDSDDSAPDQVTSRRTAPDRVPPPPREGKKTVCRYFARNGHCNRGDQCKFLHENDSERTSKAKAKPTEKKEKETRRKGLYQALLDRQTQDDDRRAMEVIVWLGQNDMLAD
ncbi:Zinc finger CCCH-type [Penicillium concentricum]|uniref:Zinc finger CCCH-type n=1 Tax=Penicillium concentricum TaxID=293559 RepID=A0A9W9RA55_9EURO|nr:Zinc finger CCCH-type [Penicillium concentricum]KAJ5356421.1 Zinc finger CCCH-type [Penicillium concentricum]